MWNFAYGRSRVCTTAYNHVNRILTLSFFNLIFCLSHYRYMFSVLRIWPVDYVLRVS